MTAVLSATDALRRDPLMASLDDNQINYSPTDWKAKYYEVADVLAETKAELDEFQTSSKELEDELIKEIERVERGQQDFKAKVSRLEAERDEWKSKFMSLQTTHNTTSTSLQRELDTVRQECQKLKVELRELEMGNDDLERTERAVSSSLADVEAKYSRTLEEKILLEQELLGKAHMEEECQRLKDELRDAGVEVSILRDRLAADMDTKAGVPTTPDPNASGWVLIMDDTPSPSKDTGKDHWPSVPSAYRQGVPTSASSPSFPKSNIPTHNTFTSRRPRSRLSGASMSTTTTASSIPTPTSRPATPTFLPLPTSSLYSNGRTTGLKSSTAPGAGLYGQPKRASLGSNASESPPPSDNGIKPHDRSTSYNARTDRSNVPNSPSFLPRLHTNGSPRGPSRMPSSTSSMSVLSQSRIGRPTLVTGRKNGFESPGDEKEGGRFLGLSGYMKSRGRTGSTFGR